MPTYHSSRQVAAFAALVLASCRAPAKVPTTTPGPSGPASGAAAAPLPCGGGRCDVPIAVSAGGAHACVVQADGSVWCWGSNTFGQLGDGTRVDRPRAARVPGINDAVQVVTGGEFTCARRRVGGVSCWGRNWFGELGTSQPRVATAPQSVPEVDDAASLAAGHAHACALRRGGGVVCWGENSMRQASPTTTALQVAPIAVAGIADARELAADAEQTCAITGGGELACWGSSFGTNDPAFVPPLHGVVIARDVVCGRTRGEALACQNNAFDRLRSQLVPGSIAFGGGKLCGSSVDGSVLCGGMYEPGNIVAGPRHLRRMAGGTAFACGIDADDVVWCWGNNLQGQLGDSTLVERSNAVRVEGLR